MLSGYRMLQSMHNCNNFRVDQLPEVAGSMQGDRQKFLQYKLCVLVSGCLNGTAPGYLSDLTASASSAAHVCSVQRQLLMSWYHQLIVHPEDCAFAVAGPRTIVEQSTASSPLNLQIVL